MSDASNVTRRAALAAGAAGAVLATGGAALAQEEPGAGIATKPQVKGSPERRWRYGGSFADPQQAADFLNLDPAQGQGEASICCMDGQFHVFYYF